MSRRSQWRYILKSMFTSSALATTKQSERETAIQQPPFHRSIDRYQSKSELQRLAKYFSEPPGIALLNFGDKFRLEISDKRNSCVDDEVFISYRSPE